MAYRGGDASERDRLVAADMTQPVLFTGFNRPETTARVFDAVRSYRPLALFVALDGPRPDRPGEDDRCSAVRAIVHEINWPCNVEYLLHEENLGCRRAMTEAIDWFFDQVEEGIILEDDCLPSPGFFDFAEALLDRYRTDERVWMICGTNVLRRWRPTEASYHFAPYGAVSGWASWRRAWQHADTGLASLDSQSRVAEARRSWGEARWDAVHPQLLGVVEGRIDTWDYGWHFTYASHGGLAAFPAENLVTNIGYGPDATHTKRGRDRLARLPAGRLDAPLIHPATVEPDLDYDRNYLAVDRPSGLLRARARLDRVLPDTVQTSLRRLLG